jgi:hypothetical protein
MKRSLQCRPSQLSAISTWAMCLICAASVLSGCSRGASSTIVGSARVYSETPSPVTESWLPIHEQDHRIVSVGEYALSSAIIIPPGIKPLAHAFVTIWTKSHHVGNVQVFFATPEEQEVYEWAEPIPFVVAHSEGFRWDSTIRRFYKRAPGVVPAMVPLLGKQPKLAPFAWNFEGIITNKYGGYRIIWSGGPPSASATRHDGQEGKPGYYSDYKVNESPEINEKRRIFLNVRYPSQIR